MAGFHCISLFEQFGVNVENLVHSTPFFSLPNQYILRI